MITKIIKEIDKVCTDKKWTIQTWFTHKTSNPHIQSLQLSNFPTKWGDIGIIPKSLNQQIHNLKIKDTESIKKKIRKIIHSYIATKWRLKFFAIYNKNLTLEEICNEENIERFTKTI